MSVVSNILDPIHDSLDPSVWDKPKSEEPRLKPKHLHWIRKAVDDELTKAGYEHVHDWATLYLTGSMTTYQYSAESDIDISLFVNVEKFPEWSRSEMIGIMITAFDGVRKLPGTSHPLQVYVVPKGIEPSDLYKPGLRSAYDLQADRWFVPPERSRAHDVQKEMKRAYLEALEDSDKLVSLLQYEPFKAGQYYKQLHRRRMRDQNEKSGDFADSNIVYKYVLRRVEQAGMLDKLSQAAGVHIASKEAAMPPKTKNKPVRKFVFNGDTGELKLWDDFAPEEGAAPSHYELGRAMGIDDPYRANTLLGTVTRSGWAQFEGGGGNQDARTQAQNAIRQAIPDLEGFLGGEASPITEQQWAF